MGRGAWWAIVHGVAGVGHISVTKPPSPPPQYSGFGSLEPLNSLEL